MSFELIAAEEGSLPEGAHVPCARALPLRSPFVSHPRAVATCARAAAARPPGGGDLHRAQSPVRRAADRERVATTRTLHEQEAGGGVDGPPGACFEAKATLADDDGLAPRRSHRTQPIAARLLGGCARSRLGGRHDVPAGARRLHLPRGHHRPVLAEDRRLVARRPTRRRAFRSRRLCTARWRDEAQGQA